MWQIVAHFEQARSLTGSARLVTVVVLDMAAVVHNGEAYISKYIIIIIIINVVYSR